MSRPKSSVAPARAAQARKSWPSAALPQGTRLRGFEIAEILGEGGFSIVYGARDLHLGREVAIKEYVPGALASRRNDATVELRSERHKDDFATGLKAFTNEARLLAQFRHPALVEILEFWEQNETAYMVMPKYCGIALRSVLRELDFTYEEDWLKGLMAPVLDVLELLHSQNVYHRDVAPDNILVKDDGGLVLLDLGSARELLQGDVQVPATVMVKSGYTPVEQYTGDGKLRQGPWTDVYAVGAVLYFAATGEAPPASISRLMRDALKPLAKLAGDRYSARFCAGVDRALAVQPQDRPQSIAELRSLLGIGADAHGTVPLARLRARPRKGGEARKDRDEKTRVIPARDLQQLAARVVKAGSGAAAARKKPEKAAPAPAPKKPSGAARKPAPAAAGARPAPAPPRRQAKAAKAQRPATGQRPAGAARAPAAAAAKPARSAASSTKREVLYGLGGLALIFAIAGGAWVMWQKSVQERALHAVAAGLVQDGLRAERAHLAETIEPSLRATAATGGLLTLPLSAGAALLAPEPVAHAELLADAVLATSASAAAQRRAAAPRRAEAVETRVARVGISVKPWAEVWVDGKKMGVSPPLSSLDLEPGPHQIELRNPGQAAHVTDVELEADGFAQVTHDFTPSPNQVAEP